MLYSKFKKYFLLYLLLALIPIFILLATYISFPSKLTIIEGDQYIYNSIIPFTRVQSSKNEVIKTTESINVISNSINIETFKTGKESLSLKIFGKFPIKTAEVDVIPKISVIPSGRTIGVKLTTKGVLVVGLAKIKNEFMPAKSSGFKVSDIIVKANDIEIKSIFDLENEIKKSLGNEIIFIVLRKNNEIKLKIKPIKDENDNYKIGLYVRDSTAGIGTMTFEIPENKAFGALGHGITDIDTGDIMQISEGAITKSEVIAVEKGEKGKPGELKGLFLDKNGDIGKILENNNCGIFGVLNKSINNEKPIKIAQRNQVKEGNAYIISNIDESKTEKFDIVIERVMRNSTEGQKGLIIRVVDKKLLEKTGGIVQGMSGSPIIQNDKLVGAVTHVFVNDPTRGYGIFVEWMIKKAININNNQKMGA